MNNTLTVQEQMHGIWKTITVISGVLCTTFFLIFWNISDPFWTGIIRLGAFIFFAVTVLGCLRLINGPLRITLSSTEDLLLVSYRKKEKVVQEEHFERSSIKKITVTKSEGNFIQTFLQPNSTTFKINFNDSDRKLYLFEFSGRPLLFGSTSQKKIMDFLQRLEIDI